MTCVGSPGASSGSVLPSGVECTSSPVNCCLSKPSSDRSKFFSASALTFAANRSLSQGEFVSSLSAMQYAERISCVQPTATRHGTEAMPICFAARSRPCPAITPPSSSIRTGIVQPHFCIERTILAT